MSTSPGLRFGIGNEIKNGCPANITVYDLEESYKIDPDTFLSKGKSTPFTGETVFGKCLLTMYNGKIAWKDENINIQEEKING
jgi:dihydroorotase